LVKTGLNGNKIHPLQHKSRIAANIGPPTKEPFTKCGFQVKGKSIKNSFPTVYRKKIRVNL
jgi:hypothetical protein